MTLQQWHLLTFPVICARGCIIAIGWNLLHFTTKFFFFDELLYGWTDIFGEHCSGSSLNFWLLIFVDNLFLSISKVDWI
jgi:hypothetical protein